LRNGLATKANLFRRKIGTSPCCPICGDESESVEHMLLLCHWVEPIWFGSYLNLRIDKRTITTFDKWLLSLSLSLKENSGDKDNIMTSVGYMCWYIWKMRCKMTIESHPLSPMAVICESHAACRSYLNAQASKNATRRPPVLVAQTPQFWSPPANGVVKINVDASWKPKLQKACIGVVL
ncbi:PREDICTED: Reverse mRNAase zinc-binding domain, partial [Prunus dulcis]